MNFMKLLIHLHFDRNWCPFSYNSLKIWRCYFDFSRISEKSRPRFLLHRAIQNFINEFFTLRKNIDSICIMHSTYKGILLCCFFCNFWDSNFYDMKLSEIYCVKYLLEDGLCPNSSQLFFFFSWEGYSTMLKLNHQIKLMHYNKLIYNLEFELVH